MTRVGTANADAANAGVGLGAEKAVVARSGAAFVAAVLIEANVHGALILIVAIVIREAVSAEVVERVASLAGTTRTVTDARAAAARVRHGAPVSIVARTGRRLMIAYSVHAVIGGADVVIIAMRIDGAGEAQVSRLVTEHTLARIAEPDAASTHTDVGGSAERSVVAYSAGIGVLARMIQAQIASAYVVIVAIRIG